MYFQVKICGELVPTKISDVPVTLISTDKSCKTIYNKGRKEKEHLQKSSFPKILKEQTGQREEKPAFDMR